MINEKKVVKMIGVKRGCETQRWLLGKSSAERRRWHRDERATRVGQPHRVRRRQEIG